MKTRTNIFKHLIQDITCSLGRYLGDTGENLSVEHISALPFCLSSLCLSEHNDAWQYERAPVCPPTKSEPQLTSSIPIVTVNTNQQTEFINVQFVFTWSQSPHPLIFSSVHHQSSGCRLNEQTSKSPSADHNTETFVINSYLSLLCECPNHSVTQLV